MSRYPLRCYEGQSIVLTGFVFESPDDPLPDTMYYLGRVVMPCCAIDARPYALPIKKSNTDYPKDTWLQVKGKLEKATVNGAEQLVIVTEHVMQVSKPDNPYGYSSSSAN